MNQIKIPESAYSDVFVSDVDGIVNAEIFEEDTKKGWRKKRLESEGRRQVRPPATRAEIQVAVGKYLAGGGKIKRIKSIHDSYSQF